MRRKDVKTIIAYFYGIPAQRRLLDQERAELEAEYNGLRGTSYDGMPHSSAPGNPTEALALHANTRSVRNRLEKIDVRDCELVKDQEMIQGCLDTIKGEYKKLIFLRYRDKYSWAKIAAQKGASDSTIRWWHDKAVDRLGEALEEVSTPDEILRRASRARV